jgi:hypothetical protein
VTRSSAPPVLATQHRRHLSLALALLAGAAIARATRGALFSGSLPDLQLFAVLGAVALAGFSAFETLTRLRQREALRSLPIDGRGPALAALLSNVPVAAAAGMGVTLAHEAPLAAASVASGALIGVTASLAFVGAAMHLAGGAVTPRSFVGGRLELAQPAQRRMVFELGAGAALVAAVAAGLFGWLAVRDLYRPELRGPAGQMLPSFWLATALSIAIGPLGAASAWLSWRERYHRVLARAFDLDRLFEDLGDQVVRSRRFVSTGDNALADANPLAEAARRQWSRLSVDSPVGALFVGLAAVGLARMASIEAPLAEVLIALGLGLAREPWCHPHMRDAIAWSTDNAGTGATESVVAALARSSVAARSLAWLPPLALALLTDIASSPGVALAAAVSVGSELFASRARVRGNRTTRRLGAAAAALTAVVPWAAAVGIPFVAARHALAHPPEPARGVA